MNDVTAAAGDDGDNNLELPSSVSTSRSTDDSWPAVSTRPLSYTATRTTTAAAAAAATDARGSDVMHHQSADEAKHRRTSSLDNSLLTNVSRTSRTSSILIK